MNIDHYWNRFDESNHYTEVLLRDGFASQASEHNEIQSIIAAREAKLANALFADGDVVSGGALKINAATGLTEATEAEIFAKSQIWSVPASQFTIPVSGSVSVGIFLTETIVSELEDANLLNPARGQASEGLPGAWRKKVTAAWGYATGDAADFFSVYEVIDGIMSIKEPPPNLEAFNLAIAQYDRDSTGGSNYICEGMIVRPAPIEDLTKQFFNLGEGRARVSGTSVHVHSGMQIGYSTSPNLREIDTEVHTAKGGTETITVAHPPVWEYVNLRITQRKTITLVHGNYSGCTDSLPDTSVLGIVEVKQGSTVYASGTSYVRAGDTLDWSPAGIEPAPGSSYTVTYDFLNTNVEPASPTKDSFVVSGAVPGSSIMITYLQALPRIDALCVNDLGEFKFLQGPASEYGTREPQIPGGLLQICSIYQDWRKTPQVVNNSVRSVSFARMAIWEEKFAWMEQEIARNRLEMNIGTREAGAKIGLFVDPLLDDSMRDQGISQTAAIIDGCLTLPLAATPLLPSADIKTPKGATQELATLLEQTLRTGSMQVNPYLSFAIPEGKATLEPAIDRWTDYQTLWASEITKIFYSSENQTLNVSGGDTWVASSRARGVILNSTSTSSMSSNTSVTTNTLTENLGTKTSAIPYLRRITINFTLEGFGPGEVLEKISFAGISVPISGNKTADADGVIKAAFQIPANVPAGVKQVEFRGRASVAYATFTGQGTLQATTLRKVQNVYSHTVNTTTVTTTRTISADPLAQTFTPAANAMLAGVDLWFTARGTTNVQVQIREVENGMPTSVVLAECLLRPANLAINGSHTRCLFDYPLPIESGLEYAIVILCNDATTALAIAEMGKFDKNVQRWVTSQPYTVGVLLSSSNASTWTAHQDRDLAFRLLKATYKTTGIDLNLGEVSLPAGTTDIMLLGAAELPAAACWNDFSISLPNNTGAVTMSDGQSISLASAISGNARVIARLRGDNSFTPVLWPGTQIVAGKLATSGDYVSRSIVATGANKAILIFDCWNPTGSAITPQIQLDSGAWQNMSLADSVNQGDGIVERRFETALSGANNAKIKILLSGTAAARPCVYNIRFMAIK